MPVLARLPHVSNQSRFARSCRRGVAQTGSDDYMLAAGSVLAIARWATTVVLLQPGEKMEKERHRRAPSAGACETRAQPPRWACGEPLAGTAFATPGPP